MFPILSVSLQREFFMHKIFKMMREKAGCRGMPTPAAWKRTEFCATNTGGGGTPPLRCVILSFKQPFVILNAVKDLTGCTKQCLCKARGTMLALSPTFSRIPFFIYPPFPTFFIALSLSVPNSPLSPIHSHCHPPLSSNLLPSPRFFVFGTIPHFTLL